MPIRQRDFEEAMHEFAKDSSVALELRRANTLAGVNNILDPKTLTQIREIRKGVEEKLTKILSPDRMGFLTGECMIPVGMKKPGGANGKDEVCYGYVDAFHPTKSIQPQYSNYTSFYQGYAAVQDRSTHEWFVIGKDGKEVAEMFLYNGEALQVSRTKDFFVLRKIMKRHAESHRKRES